MHMQLLHNDKVIIFDRTDFGPSNLSLPDGVCRFDSNDTVLQTDCTAHSILYDVKTNDFRPLVIQTDTWCSSGAVLPNGTLVQTGGYNDGDQNIRSFTPCNDGENCDWMEFPHSLIQRRWCTKSLIYRGHAGELHTCNINMWELKVFDPNPSWTMEDMPLARVMGDMILLPNGDVLIINGAESGTAGWELGRDPVTKPIIYRPSADVSDWSFAIMSPSTRPRMYHSSAILLSDGRILVSGSNPHVNYDFIDVEYPTDLSMESFSPPYLSPEYDQIRPRILSVDEKIGYGGKLFSPSFQLQVYLTANVLSVTIVAPSFATHSFSMNQRMVSLKIVGITSLSPSTYGLTVAGPSTAEIAPPGYYLLFVVHAHVPSQGIPTAGAAGDKQIDPVDSDTYPMVVEQQTGMEIGQNGEQGLFGMSGNVEDPVPSPDPARGVHSEVHDGRRSYADMVTGSNPDKHQARSIFESEDVPLQGGDVMVDRSGDYPIIKFSDRIHDTIDKNMSNFQLVVLDNNYYLVKLDNENDYNKRVCSLEFNQSNSFYGGGFSLKIFRLVCLEGKVLGSGVTRRFIFLQNRKEELEEKIKLEDHGNYGNSDSDDEELTIVRQESVKFKIEREERQCRRARTGQDSVYGGGSTTETQDFRRSFSIVDSRRIMREYQWSNFDSPRARLANMDLVLEKSKSLKQPKLAESFLKNARKKTGKAISKLIFLEALPARTADSPFLQHVLQVSAKVGNQLGVLQLMRNVSGSGVGYGQGRISTLGPPFRIALGLAYKGKKNDIKSPLFFSLHVHDADGTREARLALKEHATDLGTTQSVVVVDVAHS
ncbi:putative Pre-rRNA-processing protein TSR2 [Hibiscus syriacus]|uniref:Pre-rRNA-processing protein TSR2 n=1 Tax=Hibiscus syriacus TaxID=106335 RepID=A0A6A2YZ21_HIBSY|nr:putative Pre-rRNA-processing protein TSR2 [Hibiscus syriacus]